MSDLTTLAAAGKAACAASLAACFTGHDAVALLGALAGAMLVTFDQERVPLAKLAATALATVIFSVMLVWLIVDLMPAITKYLNTPAIDLGLGRGAMAFMFAYLAQKVILPSLGKLWTWVFTLGGRTGS